MPSRALLLTFAFILIATVAHAQAPFRIDGRTIAPGTRLSFVAQVGDAPVPITVLHGSRPGPALALVAGVHGDEFPAILALPRLRAELDPQRLTGTVILVHLANAGGFHARRIALNPADEKNLNRVFPGRADGTLTERLAHFLTQEVVMRSDYLIDLHSGSANQELWPHVYSPVVGDPALDGRTLAFARATGLRHIVLYGERPRDPDRSISLPNTAQTRGKPGLTIEIGHRGRRDEAFVDQVLAAVRNTMRHLRLLDEPEIPGAGVTLYERLHEVASPATGVFHPRAAIGELVDAGALVGEVHDYFGDRVAELRAPVRGIVLMINNTPPVREGETPVTIGQWR